MSLSETDRLSAVILAKTVWDRREVLSLRGSMENYVARLAAYQMFSVGEIAEIAGISEYKVRQYADEKDLVRVKSGVAPNHLDFLLRMVGNPTFAKIHTPTLLANGATVSALARVTGQSESSLRRWAKREDSER